ncbi:uncharacterized protein DEA37_0007508 [Paragonimus westermani]|uniref:Reverse transcriptase RNase H-like domain-containing protein n=1 Tax=Paragonimus westermani TaxID=34504 RepID=A0A5J4NVA0_9TREM|nr:uncharacterized protein DEA37_0007508 [Paragonimus westermani]
MILMPVYHPSRCKNSKVFTVELANRDDETRLRPLLRKLGPAEHVLYSNYILPAEPRTLSFADIVEKLKEVFGDICFLFNARFHRLQLVKRDNYYVVTYAGLADRECGLIKLGSLTGGQVRCLVFIYGLQAPSYSDLRSRLLTTIDQQPKTKLTMNDDYGRLINLKRDFAMILNPDRAPCSVLMFSKPQSPTGTSRANHDKPPSACRYCGAWPFHRFCTYRQHRCQKCHMVWHKDGFCSKRLVVWGKSVSVPRFKRHGKPVGRSSSLLATFKVNVAENRKFVSVHINCFRVSLQMYTVSDITIISGALWRKLGSPPVHPSSQTATSACGVAVQPTGQLHRSVSFRAATINETCNVSDSDLNLLGLDWIEQLGLLDLSIRSICNQGVGAVDSHVFPDGSENTIAQASRALSPAEKNYGQIEKEALAVIFAVKKFHKLLTDHKPLLSVYGSTKGISVYSANRLQRWATVLMRCDFSIDYRRKEDFRQADGLSRLINHHQVPEDDTVIAFLSFENNVRRQLNDAIRGILITADDIRNATAENPAIVIVMEYVRSHTLPHQPGQTEAHTEFSAGSLVYAHDYRSTHEEWIDGVVKARRAKLFVEYYSAVYNVASPSWHSVLSLQPLAAVEFSVLDVEDLLLKVNPYSVMGHDMIHPRIPKEAGTRPHKHKLEAYGNQGELLRWTASFLDNRTLRVETRLDLPSPSVIPAGVPQGSLLGPLLFLSYINDLPNNIFSNALLCADDLKIWNVTGFSALQIDLDAIKL